MENKISNFKPEASYPEQAVVMIFDLEGFSQFFSQPDVQEYVPKYLNIVFEAINLCLDGGDHYWLIGDTEEDRQYKPLPKNIHSKFLGDGGLYIWKYKDFNASQLTSLVNRFYNLKNNFAQILKIAAEVIPVIDIPKDIRFGIAAGSVYKLTYNDTDKEEYIGYSINLASRLQSYCRDIGFIFSARLNINSSKLESNRYIKKVAKNIKGFPKEFVIIDTDDYDELSDDVKTELFE
nr:hypothetical protein [Mucilaginibacter sp. L294]